MANRMSLFYAEATPMLKTLSNATTKFVSEVEIIQPLIRRASTRCLWLKCVQANNTNLFLALVKYYHRSCCFISKEGFLQLWAFLLYLFIFPRYMTLCSVGAKLMLGVTVRSHFRGAQVTSSHQASADLTGSRGHARLSANSADVV